VLATFTDLFVDIPTPVYLAALAALAVWMLVYAVYRMTMTRIKDFGMPIRRRIFCRRMRVVDDERAEVPFWWTDLQVQRAVKTYWRDVLRSPFVPQRHPAR